MRSTLRDKVARGIPLSSSSSAACRSMGRFMVGLLSSDRRGVGRPTAQGYPRRHVGAYLLVGNREPPTERTAYIDAALDENVFDAKRAVERADGLHWLREHSR